MLFELKKIVNRITQYQADKVKSVLATVVALEGSSYRKPGVSMLISEFGETTGAVSGGCVEKEVVRQALQVIDTGIPLMMTYDGRYRLGCEGVIYLLLEPVRFDNAMLDAWKSVLTQRKPLKVESHFKKDIGPSAKIGSVITLNGKAFPMRDDFHPEDGSEVFTHVIKPALRLVIIGTEHDAVQMSVIASSAGMEVIVVCAVKDPRELSDFPGASDVVAIEPDNIGSLGFDDQTAIILMTHSYSRDFQYALALLKEPYCYFGIIGSMGRKNMLFDELLSYDPEIDLDRLEMISSPAGLDLGSVTPQEIAVSVIAEIIAVTRKKALSEVIYKLSHLKS